MKYQMSDWINETLQGKGINEDILGELLMDVAEDLREFLRKMNERGGFGCVDRGKIL